MKKRLFALLMAMVMLLGMGVVSQADERVWYEVEIETAGSGGCVQFGDFLDIPSGVYDIERAYFSLDGDVVDFKFFVEELGELNFTLEKVKDEEIISGMENYNPHIMTEFNGMDVRELEVIHATNLYFNEVDGKNEVALKYLLNYERCNFYFWGKFHEVEMTTEPTIHEISAPFTGTAVSDREEYTLALAGYFEKELTDGTHELSLDEIKEQTISIVAYNKANGVKRVMTQSTIEEMSVTVSGGEVTQYVIRGRVQTNGGKLDRYTAVIEK